MSKHLPDVCIFLVRSCKSQRFYIFKDRIGPVWLNVIEIGQLILRPRSQMASSRLPIQSMQRSQSIWKAAFAIVVTVTYLRRPDWNWNHRTPHPFTTACNRMQTAYNLQRVDSKTSGGDQPFGEILLSRWSCRGWRRGLCLIVFTQSRNSLHSKLELIWTWTRWKTLETTRKDVASLDYGLSRFSCRLM